MGTVALRSPVRHGDGLTLRQAAVIAGLGYLLMPVTYAEFSIMPRLVIAGDIGQTVQNISAHPRLMFAAILCHLITFIEDVVIAWALYILLAPVNRALSLLTAWFRLIFVAVGLCGWLNLVAVLRLLTTPEYLSLFGSGPLHAQAKLLLDSFQWDWSISLMIFGIHLLLLGYLVYRSGYIPRVLGIILAIVGVAWLVNGMQHYLFPQAPLGFLNVIFAAELLFMAWLLIRGWKIPQRPLSTAA